MAACARCGISRDDLPEGYVCRDCMGELKPTQKAKDFIEWLKRKHPEEYERALMNNADDEVVQ